MLPLRTLFSEAALRDLNTRFESAHPREILRWAIDEPGLPRIAIASAFQAEGTAVMHMATRIRPDMLRALRDLDAWITAFRRDSSPTRARAPFVDQYELEPGRFITKVNPVAAWTRRDVWRYLAEHDLPHNPLYDLGYASIGCAPCTRVRLPGEPERAGRWAGLSKWECGIQEAPGAPGRTDTAGPVAETPPDA